MSRGKAINVKIATTKVIKALEEAKAKLEKTFASQEANEAKYQKAHTAWKKEVGKLALAQITKAEGISACERYNDRERDRQRELTTERKKDKRELA